MNLIYLGVDVAGASNTWVAGLAQVGDSLTVAIEPCRISLDQVIGICKERDVVAVAIDAQLAISPSAENGLRASDQELRKLLPSGCQNWVMSFNSLMAVPIRGLLLSESVAPIVGTVLETHPRASLLLGLGDAAQAAVDSYKKGPDKAKHVSALWQRWADEFNIQFDKAVVGDGALDSLVCATVAYLYHHDPQRLHKLRYGLQGIRGRGPFYVVVSGEG